jgi:radical SAM superfamily enzyme YgiQ (UPF0313 family)
MTHAVIFSDIMTIGYGKNTGAYMIATQLRKHGFTCQVVDFFSHYTIDEMINIIDKFVDKDTLWVGFSSTFLSRQDESLFETKKLLNAFENQNKETLSQLYDPSMFEGIFPHDTEIMKLLFRYIRHQSSKVKIIVGGSKASIVQNVDETIRRIVPDYYITGHADDSIVVFTKWLYNDKKYPEPIFSGPKKNIIDSFRDYEYSNFNTSKLKFEKEDLVEPNEILPIEIARGCVFQCKFCNFPLLGKKRGDYTKTKDTLVEEFIYNYENFGTTGYMFMDETTNDSLEKTEFLLDVTSSLPFKISWSGYARIELYNTYPEMAHIMKETGLVGHFFGIETFNKKSGEAIGKGMHPDKVKETLKYLKDTWKEDVSTTTGIIIGLPHDTKEYVDDLTKFLLSDDCHLTGFSIYPLILVDGMGSLFGQNPGKWGYKFTPGDPLHHWYNEHMTFEQASQYANQLRLDTIKRNSLQNFSKMRIANLNFPMEKLNNFTLYDYILNMDEMTNLLKIKKQLYFNKLMSL